MSPMAWGSEIESPGAKGRASLSNSEATGRIVPSPTQFEDSLTNLTRTVLLRSPLTVLFHANLNLPRATIDRE